MKRSVEIFFYVCLGLIVASVFLIAMSMIATNHVQLGPHQVYTWKTGFTTELNGNYHLESSDYFEVIQANQPPIQAKFQDPEVGQSKGSYVISTDLKGTFQVSHPVTIYSLETSQATFVATSGEIVSDIFLSCILGLVFFLLLILLMSILI